MSDGAVGAYFERVGASAFHPTTHVGGGWDPTELHFSPLGGLIVHAIEQYRRDGSGLVLGRISYDILGRLAADTCEIEVTTIRPGRTIELVEATLSIGGRAVIRARAWYLATYDSAAVAGGEPPALPAPDEFATWPISNEWPGGYIASLDVRPVEGPKPGRTTAWIRSSVDLVAGEPVTDLAALIAITDTANGIATREPPTKWMYPNVDLTVHLFRQPTGRWLGLDTAVTFGRTGQGVTRSVLHDQNGAIGAAEQLLTVRAV